MVTMNVILSSKLDEIIHMPYDISNDSFADIVLIQEIEPWYVGEFDLLFEVS